MDGNLDNRADLKAIFRCRMAVCGPDDGLRIQSCFGFSFYLYGVPSCKASVRRRSGAANVFGYCPVYEE